MLLALVVGGCDSAPPSSDAGRFDAARSDSSVALDGATHEDATMDGGSLPRTCLSPEGADPMGTDRLDDVLGRATVTIENRNECLRRYTLTSTAELRDSEPTTPRIVSERAGSPTLRTGNDLFDALFALTLEEVRELSVTTIRDYAFDGGNAIDCGGCFETGRLWTYVWTRDTSYAVDLGLAAVDPVRSRASLEFKLSERRGGGDLQVVQDTGSGGSYPVSTDRVVWALGASALLSYLSGADRDAFRDRALTALRNTIEHDRRVVFDASDGLYFGEQSFLDWREQTYPEWTANDVVHIAMSKALGTNILHLRALEIARDLANESGDSALRTRYAAFADALRTAIRTRFWLVEDGLFSSHVTTFLDRAPVRRYDLLASSLAIIHGVATEEQARRILESYPHYGPGAPVIWPQQQRTPIYHNRGEWPFVTAYWLRAAARANNEAVAERMVRALVRGTALNLSNMENFEAGSGRAWLEDGEYSGPVVNSQRQLWSVAGYLSMVHHTIFGLEAGAEGVRVRPYVTEGMRAALFSGSRELVLNDFPWRGRRISVVLHLPEGSATGAFGVGSITLNGAPVTGDLLPEASLEATNRVEVVLSASSATNSATLTEVDGDPWQNVFGPRTPRITALTNAGGRIQLALDRGGEAEGDVTFTIYKDGAVIASGVPGSMPTFTDTASDTSASSSPCYAVELVFVGSGNRSQHSPPACYWGSGNVRVVTISAQSMSNVGGLPSTAHGRFHYEPWGDAGHSLTVSAFNAAQTGSHLLQLVYGNGAGPVNTGITCAVKRIVVEDVETGAIVAEGPVVMPHLGLDNWGRWADSSFVRAELVRDRTYRVVIRGDDEMVNMSSFAHFERYTGGLGGRSGAYNRVNIAELKILAL